MQICTSKAKIILRNLLRNLFNQDMGQARCSRCSTSQKKIGEKTFSNFPLKVRGTPWKHDDKSSRVNLPWQRPWPAVLVHDYRSNHSESAALRPTVAGGSCVLPPKIRGGAKIWGQPTPLDPDSMEAMITVERTRPPYIQHQIYFRGFHLMLRNIMIYMGLSIERCITKVSQGWKEK